MIQGTEKVVKVIVWIKESSEYNKWVIVAFCGKIIIFIFLSLL